MYRPANSHRPDQDIQMAELSANETAPHFAILLSTIKCASNSQTIQALGPWYANECSTWPRRDDLASTLFGTREHSSTRSILLPPPIYARPHSTRSFHMKPQKSCYTPCRMSPAQLLEHNNDCMSTFLTATAREALVAGGTAQMGRAAAATHSSPQRLHSVHDIAGGSLRSVGRAAMANQRVPRVGCTEHHLTNTTSWQIRMNRMTGSGDRALQSRRNPLRIARL